MNDKKTRLLLIDDHALILSGLKSLLSELEELEIVGLVSSFTELTNGIDQAFPDVVIADIQMPDKSGFEYVETIKLRYPDCKVIFISMYHHEEYIVKALELGCSGYILKSTNPDEMVEGIREVVKGNHYFSKSLSEELLNTLVLRAKFPTTQTLTKREIEIIRQLCQGLSNKAIADNLFVSVRTIEFHRANIFKKLGITNSVELVKYAIKYKIIEL